MKEIKDNEAKKIIRGKIYVYCIFILLFNKANRQNVKNILFWFMVAELLTDLVWILLYYNNSEYVNYGIGAVYGLLLWPVALGTAGVIVSCQNKKHHKER